MAFSNNFFSIVTHFMRYFSSCKISRAFLSATEITPVKMVAEIISQIALTPTKAQINTMMLRPTDQILHIVCISRTETTNATMKNTVFKKADKKPVI